MTRLLVSVRSAAEAELAVAAGADVIDVKEPTRGPLGAADWPTIAEVIEVVAGRVPVSAALGELCDWSGPLPEAIAAGLQFAKFGLAGCGLKADWPERWRGALLPSSPKKAIRTLTDQVLAEARRMNCRAILVDTHDKHGGGLLDLWPLQTLACFVAEARQAEMLVALAGGLALADLERVLAARPDLIGVRGAACSGGRAGRLDSARVRQLAKRVRPHGVPERSALGGEFISSPGV
jgi:uncharacterized protein (UPF0264 family)